MPQHNAGAIITLQAPEDGDNEWTAEQIQTSPNLPPGDTDGRTSIDWRYGPVAYEGYFDTNTFEIGLSPAIAGLNVGIIYGNLKDGVNLKIDLDYYKGLTRFYLKNGNEVWTHLDVKVSFDGHFEGDYKIFTF
ncbi:hypothetical protein FHETE_976 [Fusarium heterosporum]|uniref:Uncharacterized protein n=1 Tax=Fusarium heterosporum TaxID=42747 RepID=A0A8H5X1V3_FUSHE|nr:hypothetical protein FHETE_976 [Fusarium heterosporum]